MYAESICIYEGSRFLFIAEAWKQCPLINLQVTNDYYKWVCYVLLLKINMWCWILCMNVGITNGEIIVFVFLACIYSINGFSPLGRAASTC